MKRWLLNISAGLSLLMFIVAIVLWIDSLFFFSHHDVTVVLDKSKKTGWVVGLRNLNHELVVSFYRYPSGSGTGFERKPAGKVTYTDFLGKWGKWRLGPIGYANRQYPIGRTTYRFIVIPHGLLAILFAIGPTIWLIKWRKRRKLGANTCPTCGYDLTGNKTGECPECGVELKAAA